MPVSTEITRLVLRKIASDAVGSSITLLSALQSAAFGTVSTTLTGKILIETQSGGTLSRYELPVGTGALRPQDVAQMLSSLLDLYDAALTALGSPTDAQVLAWILGQLTVVRSFRTDFSNSYIR